MSQVRFNGIMPESGSLGLPRVAIQLQFCIRCGVNRPINQQPMVVVLPNDHIESLDIFNTVIVIVFGDRNRQIKDCQIIPGNSLDFRIVQVIIVEVSMDPDNAINLVTEVNVSMAFEQWHMVCQTTNQM